jgi:anti-anti-sigma factor
MSGNGPTAERPASLEVRTEEADGSLILRLSGDLDLSSTPEFERAVAWGLDTSPKRLVLDLTGLTFIDSCGLRAILTAQRAGERAQCALSVVPGEQARRLFDLTGVSESLPLTDPPAQGASVA